MNVWLCVTTPPYALITWYFINPYSAQWPIRQPLLRLPKVCSDQTITCLLQALQYLHLTPDVRSIHTTAKSTVYDFCND